MQKKVIGLDIGGSKITGIVFSGGKVLKELTIVTPKNLKDFKYSLAHLLKFLAVDNKINGVGVGVAGIVDRNKSVVDFSPNMRFLDAFNFKQFLKANNFKKVAVENDANCFALAESAMGQGKNFKNFVGVTLGTGIGGGLISKGQIYRGSHGSAGEVGHMMADPAYTYENYLQKGRNSKNFGSLGKTVGLLVASIINILDPEAVILGGSVTSRYYTKFLPVAKIWARKQILNKQINPKILVSKLKHAGAIGAALLVV